MNTAMITRADFGFLVKILEAFLANERPLDLVLAAAKILEKLRPQQT
jgi:hypothetical protein